MSDPLGPVVITSREIYDQLVRVGDALGEVARRIDRLADGHDETKRDVSDHESRLRFLERRQWPLPTLSIVLSVGTLGAMIVLKFV